MPPPSSSIPWTTISGVREGPGPGKPKNFAVPCSIKSSAVMIRSTDNMRGDQVANSIVVSPLFVAVAGLCPADRHLRGVLPSHIARAGGVKWMHMARRFAMGARKCDRRSSSSPRQCGDHNLREGVKHACAAEPFCRYRPLLRARITGERTIAQRKEPVRRDGDDDRTNRARDLHEAGLPRLGACTRP